MPVKESAFALVELIVAVLILSVVITSASLAVGSFGSSQSKTKAVADLHAVAVRAQERVQGDLVARSACENQTSAVSTTASKVTPTAWRIAARSAVVSGTSGAASFNPCTVTYSDMTDQNGRRFAVAVSIVPKDSPADGTGTGDADGNLRDSYASNVNVKIIDKEGVEQVKPVDLAGSVDWSTGARDYGSVKVTVCGLFRPDRSVELSECNTTDGVRTPLAGATVKITPSGAGDGAKPLTLSTNAQGVALATAVVEPGSYKVGVTLPGSLTGWTRQIITPSGIQVTSGGTIDVLATYSRATNRSVTICAQIGNFRAPDEGYEVLNTNLTYHGTGSPGYRVNRLTLRADRGWACDTADQITDPFRYNSTSAFQGQYDVEVEQVADGSGASIDWGLKVANVTQDCSTGLAWDQPLNGAALQPRPFDAANDRPRAASEVPGWFGRYALTDSTSSHSICVRLESKQKLRCTPNSGDGCTYIRTDCIQYCPNGATICTANCDKGAPGGSTSGPVLSGEIGTPVGGPTDETVGCRPRAQGAYQWFGWSPGYPYVLPGQMGANVPQSDWQQYQWVGGGSYYYNGYTGHHAGDGQVFYCDEVSFTGDSTYLCYANSNTPVDTSGRGGFAGCRYHFGDCVRAELQGYPGVYIQGIVNDVATGYDAVILPTIGGLRSLALMNNIDRQEVTTFWNPGSWWSTLRLNVWKVDGAPSCEYGVDNAPRMEHRDPVMEEIWVRDDPALFDPPARTATGNIGTDATAL